MNFLTVSRPMPEMPPVTAIRICRPPINHGYKRISSAAVLLLFLDLIVSCI
jgi:hypothetical protein